MRNHARLLLLPALVMPLLTSCGQGVSDLKAPSACPAIVPYSAEFQAKLADELAALPAESVLIVAMLDYKRERDQLRECQD